jgi:WD40 repeat protein
MRFGMKFTTWRLIFFALLSIVISKDALSQIVVSSNSIDSPTAIACDEDRSQIFVGEADGTLSKIRLINGKYKVEISKFFGTGSISELVFASDKKILFSASTDGVVRSFSVNLQAINSFRHKDAHSIGVNSNNYLRLSLSANQKKLGVIGGSQIVELTSEKFELIGSAPVTAPRSVAYEANGKMLVGESGGIVKLVDQSTLRIIKIDKMVWGLGIKNDRTIIASTDGEIIIIGGNYQSRQSINADELIRGFLFAGNRVLAFGDSSKILQINLAGEVNILTELPNSQELKEQRGNNSINAMCEMNGKIYIAARHGLYVFNDTTAEHILKRAEFSKGFNSFLTKGDTFAIEYVAGQYYVGKNQSTNKTHEWIKIYPEQFPPRTKINGQNITSGIYSDTAVFVGTMQSKEIWRIDLDLKEITCITSAHQPGGFTQSSSSLAYTKERGGLIASGGDDRHIRIFDSQNCKYRGQIFIPESGDRVSSIAFSESGNRLIYRLTHGSIGIADIESRQHIASIYLTEDGALSILANGFFSITNGKLLQASTLWSVRDSRSIGSLDEYFDVFHRPDLVRRTLESTEFNGKNIPEKYIMRALSAPPPSTHLGEIGQIAFQARIRLPYIISSNGGGIGEVLVFHNGKLVKSDGYYRDAPGSTLVALNTTKASSRTAVAAGVAKMLNDGEAAPAASTGSAQTRNSVVIRQAKPKVLNTAGEYHDSVEIDVIPGEDNEITVMARNADNTILGQGQTVRFKSTLPKAEPHLWILPVGIGSFADRSVPTLASPKKDALDFACNYGGKEGLKAYGLPCDQPGYAVGLFKPGNIHVVEPLTNEKATRANILAKLDEVAAKARPSDTFVWFVSSHGTMDANSVYGIVPFDAKCKGNDCAGLVSSNDILDKSKAIKAMKQLLVLDTCQAGGLDNKMSGLYDARMTGLAKNMGLHLYAAATATESALDGQDASKNSVFTATLLEGLSGKAPRNSEGAISIIPLGQYVKTQTPEAARKAWGNDMVQTPLVQHFGKDAPLAANSGLR